MDEGQARGLSARQQQCLQGIGIRQWHERSNPVQTGQAVVAPTMPSPIAEVIAPVVETLVAEVQPVARLLDSWVNINHSIHQCVACELAKNCSQKVPGVGHQQARLMIIGEAPGHDEDLKGEPFVGRSGQLLDRLLLSIGLTREQTFITNIVKCRPPDNRDPHSNEVASCKDFLRAQIEQIKPRVILLAGRVSAQSVLNTTSPVGQLIKQVHQLPELDIPVKVTYHPAYLLRNPGAKAIAWKDMKTLHRMLEQ